MKTHTPGPWFYNAKKAIIGQQDPSLPNDNSNRPVALLHRLTTEEDAALITAAPDLLEALKAFLAAESSGGFTKSGLQVIQQARAAIAKAEGK